MNSLIEVSNNIIGSEEVNSVNARDLWKELEIAKDFSNWIKAQLKRGLFEENRDYNLFAQKGEKVIGGRPLIEYILTLDTAKEIAMMSGTKKGKEVRNYFIEVEKQLKQSKVEIKKENSLIITKMAEFAMKRAEELNIENKKLKLELEIAKTPKSYKVVTEIQKDKMKKMIKKGNSIPQIERELKLTRKQVTSNLRKMGLYTPSLETDRIIAITNNNYYYSNESSIN